MQEGSSAVRAALWGCSDTSVSWAGAVQEHQELNLLQLRDRELIQASWTNWSPSGGAKFRDSQPVPCCPRTRLGVPGMEPQKPWVHFPTHQGLCVALGRLQSLWHSALIQPDKFCLYLLLAALLVVCEPWQNLLAGKGGDLESSRSLFFPGVAMQSRQWWFHQRFAHNLVYGSQIGFYRA